MYDVSYLVFVWYDSADGYLFEAYVILSMNFYIGGDLIDVYYV